MDCEPRMRETVGPPMDSMTVFVARAAPRPSRIIAVGGLMRVAYLLILAAQVAMAQNAAEPEELSRIEGHVYLSHALR
jgi:hypothetical protein